MKAPGLVREGSGSLGKNRPRRGVSQPSRKGAEKQTERQREKASGTEVGPELSYKFGEGPRTLPTLISFSGQAFGLLLKPATQSPES